MNFTDINQIIGTILFFFFFFSSMISEIWLQKGGRFECFMRQVLFLLGTEFTSKLVCRKIYSSYSKPSTFIILNKLLQWLLNMILYGTLTNLFIWTSLMCDMASQFSRFFTFVCFRSVDVVVYVYVYVYVFLLLDRFRPNKSPPPTK